MANRACWVLTFTLVSLALTAQEIPDGQWSWRFIAGGATVAGPMTPDNRRFYFTAEDRFLYALSNGVMVWRTDLQRRPTGALALGPDGSIYVPLEDGRLLALNKDGRLLWEVQLARGRVLAPVVMASGLVIVSDRSGTVLGLTHAGHRVWQLETGVELSVSPVVDSAGLLRVATVEGYLLSIDTDGRLISRRFVGSVAATLAPLPDGILVGSTLGHLVRFDAANEPLWRADLGSAIAELVAAPDKSAYARLDDGSVARVTRDGVIAWRAHPVPHRIAGIVSAGGVVVAISGGSIGFIQPGGSLEWQFPLRSDPVAMRVVQDQLIVSTSDWVTYAYSIPVEPSGPWPASRGDERGSGRLSGVSGSRVPPLEYQDILDYIYLAEFLRSEDQSDQLSGLGEIEERIPNGLRGSYSYVLDLCEEVAGAGSAGRIGGTRPLPSIQARRVALSILGHIGDLGTARYLVRLLRDEPAGGIHADIVDALSRLGSGTNGSVVGVISSLLNDRATTVPDERLAQAAVAAVESIYMYEGGFLSEDGVGLLSTIATGPYQATTRRDALLVLERLSRL